MNSTQRIVDRNLFSTSIFISQTHFSLLRRSATANGTRVTETREGAQSQVAEEPSCCCHCLAKLAKASTPPIKPTQRPMRTKAKRTLKKQSPSDKPALKPDDLPQVEGFCCGHAYLKLSDSQGCACLCQQCIGKSSMKQTKGVVPKVP